MTSVGLVLDELVPKSIIYKNITKNATGDIAKLIKFDKGTTTLAFRYQNGAIVACDSRASQGTFIASQTVKKIIEITPTLLGTMAGGAADCSFWERYMTKMVKLYELQNNRKIPVDMVAKQLSDIMYHYYGYGLCCGVMICGYDDLTSQTRLFYVDDKGTQSEGQMFSIGSGAQYAYGVLDAKYRWELTDEEAIELGRRAIYQAAYRDGASGGVIRVYKVDSTGWTRIIAGEDHYEAYQSYKNACTDC